MLYKKIIFLISYKNEETLILAFICLIMQSYCDDDDDGNICAKDNPSGADDCKN